MTHAVRPFRSVALPTLLAMTAAGLAGCATTGTSRAPDPALNARPASSEDCRVIAMTLELFPRPADGTPLKVADVALVQSPSFRPQTPEQVAHEPLSLRTCRAILVAFVPSGATVVLNRPEIHDNSVLVRYREGQQTAVYAELERTPEGHWRHIGAFISPN